MMKRTLFPILTALLLTPLAALHAADQLENKPNHEATNRPQIAHV